MNPSFLFRPTTLNDLAFYISLFRDAEWMHNSGFRLEDFQTDPQMLSFMECHRPMDLKGVIVDAATGKDLAICHFKQTGEDELELAGGIRKELLDKGTGLYIMVCCLDYAFKNRDVKCIHSIIYEKNVRSIRINEKIGYVRSGSLTYDVRLFYDYSLTSDVFYNNPFNQHCLVKHGICSA